MLPNHVNFVLCNCLLLFYLSLLLVLQHYAFQNLKIQFLGEFASIKITKIGNNTHTIVTIVQ